MRLVAPSAAIAFALLAPPSARADVNHVVQRGHTIEAIAHRYHVSEKAIVEANHLKDTKHLKPGTVLVIPGVDSPKSKAVKGSAAAAASANAPPQKPSAARLEPRPAPRGRSEEGAIVAAARDGEQFRIKVKDSKNHISTSALEAFRKLLHQGNATHAVDPRLVALVGIVSSHFGGKTIEVVSGYRAYTPTQYTAHSNHNLGKAIDFRIHGVGMEALRDFCHTLRNAGCGYYPRSTFVHLDVRDSKAAWTDWSRPGEPPKYDKPGVEADEGTSDVPDAPPLQGESSSTQPSHD